MPYKNGTIVQNATNWTDEMIQFLKDNFFTMTNPQLAQSLNLRLTVTRNKCKELGLRRIEMEYWTVEQVQFLKDNYTNKGDVEIAEIFEQRWPKNKKWIKQHICKKRKYLKLKRTKEQVFAIASKNSLPGGNSYTVLRNSSSLNMHPVWISQQIAWRNPELQKEIRKYPSIIELKKQSIILKRAINGSKRNTAKA